MRVAIQCIGSLWVLLVLLNSSACEEGTPTVIGNTPVIELVDVIPTTVQEFQEKLYIHLAYEDGNGDLGFFNPDLPSVFVKDSRLTEYDAYHIPPLAPTDSEVAIKGILTVELKNTFILGVDAIESQVITYDIKVVDRAGNESDVITTMPITIIR